jgi:hypothetical protein
LGAVLGKSHVFSHQAKRAVAALLTAPHSATSAFCVQQEDLLLDGQSTHPLMIFSLWLISLHPPKTGQCHLVLSLSL